MPASVAVLTGRRARYFSLIFALVVAVAVIRTVSIQVIDSDGNAAAAAANMKDTETIKAARGAITDRDGNVLAENYAAVRIFADPWGMKSNGITDHTLSSEELAKAAAAPQAIAEILARYLPGEVSDFLWHFSKTQFDDGEPNQYQVIAENIPEFTFRQIQIEMSAGGWYGIFAEPTPIRSYPNGDLASNVVGFTTQMEDQSLLGLAGIEQWFNDELRGTDGSRTFTGADLGEVPLGANTLVPAQDGYNIQLTIDAALQYAVQQELAAAVRTRGTQGWAVVMNIKTGEVLALANYPSFDANTFGDADAEDLGNRAVSWVYEPGSVQKVITMGALLDQGLITPDTHIAVPGTLTSGWDEIEDSWSHGTLYMTARGVLADSSNIGTALLARDASKESLAHYWELLGLGKPTGIQLPGEGSGELGLVPSADMEDYQRDRAAFGQSISVTALQEAAAIAALVNGGVYNAPTIISHVTTADGVEVPIPKQEPRRVISPEASADLRDMMEAVVAGDGNTSRMIDGYRMIGKTGTASRINPDTGAYDSLTGSFIGIAPAEDPTLLVYVVIDDTSWHGSVVAVPPVKDIMQYALPRYGFAPNNDIPAYTKPSYY
jgi:cell division protein FtsI (penicillin-binding protein 3)